MEGWLKEAHGRSSVTGRAEHLRTPTGKFSEVSVSLLHFDGIFSIAQNLYKLSFWVAIISVFEFSPLYKFLEGEN